MNAIKTWWNRLAITMELDVFNGFEVGLRHISGDTLDEAVDLGEGNKHHFGVLLTIACFSAFFVFMDMEPQYDDAE